MSKIIKSLNNSWRICVIVGLEKVKPCYWGLIPMSLMRSYKKNWKFLNNLWSISLPFTFYESEVALMYLVRFDFHEVVLWWYGLVIFFSRGLNVFIFNLLCLISESGFHKCMYLFWLYIIQLLIIVFQFLIKYN